MVVTSLLRSLGSQPPILLLGMKILVPRLQTLELFD
jgi:hypothetical protein